METYKTVTSVGRFTAAQLLAHVITTVREEATEMELEGMLDLLEQIEDTMFGEGSDLHHPLCDCDQCHHDREEEPLDVDCVSQRVTDLLHLVLKAQATGAPGPSDYLWVEVDRLLDEARDSGLVLMTALELAAAAVRDGRPPAALN